MKTNVDSGPLLAVQEAGAFALDRADEFGDPIRRIYATRRAVALKMLSANRFEFFKPQASFYVWARVPNQMGSMNFCKLLIEKASIIVTPGIGFGEEGEHFFRLALTVDAPVIESALDKMSSVIQSIR